ncbi:hypothetical protein [Frankia sp. QA3]|uniref:hypothetical protein n=1 Tax=Frankia sp. QA3 TaxID=710111 RepID=UPI000269C8A1|nr:hypothetical protein [Frankia sp. QA3]EIV94597.1 hypothetical protein FraQA3DRAFT_4363 [Frankia sp. QA3]
MPSIQGIDEDGSGFGVKGTSPSGTGVIGEGPSYAGVVASSVTGSGVSTFSDSGAGVLSLSNSGPGVSARSLGGVGVSAESEQATGMTASSVFGVGVSGESRGDNGVFGTTEAGGSSGVFGRNTSTEGGNGVVGLAEGFGGIGVFGQAAARGTGVVGNGATGIVARGDAGPGLDASSEQQEGVKGEALRDGFAAVAGTHAAGGVGVRGESLRGGSGVEGYGLNGVVGTSESSAGVVGRLGAAPSSDWGMGGVVGVATPNGASGVRGMAFGGFGAGITGESDHNLGMGVVGRGKIFGVVGKITDATPNVFAAAVQGSAEAEGHTAVAGRAVSDANGVAGYTESGTGVIGWASGSGTGVFGFSPNPKNVGPYAFAGSFHGAVNVTGPIHKSGGGFIIDHPQDPQNKYLHHCFVESDQRKNVYDGIVELDADGSADVTLPSWFEALNQDFRYQLTPLGSPAPELHIQREVSHGTFRIGGGRSGQRVSWQVTGVRADLWAQRNVQSVEMDKTTIERGLYRHPELYGEPIERGIDWVIHGRAAGIVEAIDHLQRGASEQDVNEVKGDPPRGL